MGWASRAPTQVSDLVGASGTSESTIDRRKSQSVLGSVLMVAPSVQIGFLEMQGDP